MPFFKSVSAPIALGIAALALTGCATETTPQAGGDVQTSTSASEKAESPEAPAEVTVTTAQGDVTVPFQPSSVVVIDHGILDTIDALGAGDSVAAVPHDRVPTYLTEYETSTDNAGTFEELDYRVIEAAEPDLIIVGGESAESLTELEAVAPTIDLSFDWGTEGFMSSFESNTLALGQIFGAEEQAEIAVAEIQARAKVVAASTGEAGEGLVVIVGPNHISAHGPGPDSQFDYVYNLLGVTPAIDQATIDAEGDAVSFAFLADLDPELLIVLDQEAIEGEPGKGARDVVDNFVARSMTAVLNDQVAYVDTEKWYLAYGGLTAVASTFDEVAALVG